MDLEKELIRECYDLLSSEYGYFVERVGYGLDLTLNAYSKFRVDSLKAKLGKYLKDE